jgi:quinol-cytochrome oxidoreductase complex cytochrome b subunit
LSLLSKYPLLEALYYTAIIYKTPSTLNYFFNFGIYALVCLLIQLLTGIALAMHYAPEVSMAFISVEHIMRDVNEGWVLRYLHANGASMFFIVVYAHIFKALFYSSFAFPRQLLWDVGVVILLIMIATAFMGYVLPWGQMSFWGATVITNLFSAIPVVGNDVVIWLWGGYSIDNATLNRFFSLHFVLPFVIAGLVGIHLLLLHEYGSNNPIGLDFSFLDGLPFAPYYIIKDLYGVILFFIFFGIFVFFMPNTLGHPDNYIPANAMVTPPHIVPEWYFLPFYAILRSIPDKLLGVLALLCAIITLLLLPLTVKPEVRSLIFRPLSRYLFWFFVIDCVILDWIGSKSVSFPYIQIGQAATIFYFSYFFMIYPVFVSVEKFFWSNRYYLSKFGI